GRQRVALPCGGGRESVALRCREGAARPHGRGGQTRTALSTAQLAGAPCGAPRPFGAAGRPATRQGPQCQQRKGQTPARLGAAPERGGHRRHRRKPCTASAFEGRVKPARREVRRVAPPPLAWYLAG